jgi:hypothetical protein
MANTSHKEDDRFFEDVIGLKSNLLETAAEWIADNLEPGDVYSEEKLEEWALENGFVREVV